MVKERVIVWWKEELTDLYIEDVFNFESIGKHSPTLFFSNCINKKDCHFQNAAVGGNGNPLYLL
ncbi:MAG: hypothetical protein J1F40_08955 [Prevotellaceae bacterium]|nr:hypothetical protein [Prevotellaceae bacterium]